MQFKNVGLLFLRLLLRLFSWGSRRWKLRWQPHAAHFRERGSEGTVEEDGMNSPQPSRAWPPMLAAWFLRHSL